MRQSAALRHETWWIVFFSLFAAVRVFLFCVAFPFFNNVDERRHFDLVVKYANGHVPSGPELISPETLPFLAWYASPEFLSSPSDFEGGYFGPLWKHPAEEVAPTIARIEEIWGRTPNQECSQPPLYYVAAAGWFRIGELIGLKNGSALYWVRYLNVGFVVMLVLLAYASARSIFPDQLALRLGIPLFIAAIPQDAFYGIDNDVLSSICFGFAFVCLVWWTTQKQPTISLGIVTGLSIAATYLAKLSNVPLVLIALVVIAWWSLAQLRSRTLSRAVPALGALVVCAAIPIFAWLLWVKLHFGDFTGAASKAQLLGWTAKPVSEWWPHPIFTPSGMWTFLSELIATFWRGEFMWHARPIGSKAMDLFYVFSSFGLIAVAIVSLLRRRGTDVNETQRRVLWIATGCVLATIIFLGLLSLQFDFGRCINPSRERPYFFQGRLLSGAMIPFATLYVYALNRLCRGKPALVLAVVAAIALSMTVSDFLANSVAFTSAYNWFHL